MFRRPRRVVPPASPRLFQPGAFPEQRSPVQPNAGGYDAGVRQVMNENRGFAAIAGVVMIAFGGSMIASQAYEEHASRTPCNWRCESATTADEGGCGGIGRATLSYHFGDQSDVTECSELVGADEEASASADTLLAE